MALPDLSQLPPWAAVAFAISLAIIVGMAWLGEKRGKASGSPQHSAQVAAVIVDPTALQAAAAEVSGLAVTLTEATVAVRAHTAAVDRQADKVDELSDGLNAVRDQLIRIEAKMG